MKKEYRILMALLFIILGSCTQIFDEHYGQGPETIDKSIWESIRENPDYTSFVALFEEYGFDSIFAENGSYTIFVPNNEAFKDFNQDTGDVAALLKFHVLNFPFNLGAIPDSRSVQTYGGKFSLVENHDGVLYFDGSEVMNASLLHRDGQYYEIGEIAYPKNTLYEHIALTCKVMQAYIDNFDSIILDLEKSIPIGFDDEGNTIYDSVYTVANYFDTLYYPVKEEHRSRTATFVLFDDEQYHAALEDMALDLGGSISGEEIPAVWQEEVLFPELVATSLFPNSLEYEDFVPGQLRNIQGDTVEVDYTNIVEESRNLSSNGVTFDYLDFKVPRYLYKGEIHIEGEHMIDSVASSFYVWKPGFEVSGSPEAVSAIPLASFLEGARNDTLLVLQFPRIPFEGEFSLEFKFTNMFPQEYLFRWAGKNRPSGTYNIYANGKLISTFDSFNFYSPVFSVIPGYYYLPFNGYNTMDALIDNALEYGDVTIRLEYISRGFSDVNGISIDYISLTPTDVVEFQNQ